MPNRIIKESICTSDTLASLSAEAERFFFRLLVQCDDFGRFDGRQTIIRAACFPLQLDQIQDADIEDWLFELVEADLIRMYAVDGKPYLQITTWDKHQKRRAQHSKFPSIKDGCEHMLARAGNGKQMSAFAALDEKRNRDTNSNARDENDNDHTRADVAAARDECQPSTSPQLSSSDMTTMEKAFERAFGFINSHQQEKLVGYLEDGFDEETVVLAIQKAAETAKPCNYAYGILNNWRSERLFTVEAVEHHEQERTSQHRIRDAPVDLEALAAEVVGGSEGGDSH